MSDETKKNKDKKRFFKDFKAELKKVIWPTPKQIVNNTIAVVTIVIATALIVLILDLAFEALNSYGINKLRNLVPENNVVTINENTNSESENTENTDNAESVQENESAENNANSNVDAEENKEETNETSNTQEQ